MIMALRASLKVPKYGLFYFPIDQTTSVVPVKNIQTVVHGDNKSEGSKVRVEFEGHVHDAEIIAVNGKMLIFCFTVFVWIYTLAVQTLNTTFLGLPSP